MVSSRSETSQNMKNIQIESIQLASPGGCSSPPGSSLGNPKTGCAITCRLAARLVPQGSSLSRTQNNPKKKRCVIWWWFITRQAVSRNSKKHNSTRDNRVYAFNLAYISCNYQHENKRYDSAPLT